MQYQYSICLHIGQHHLVKPTIGSTLSKLSKSTSSPVAPRLARRCRVIMTTQLVKQRMLAGTTWRGRILKFQTCLMKSPTLSHADASSSLLKKNRSDSTLNWGHPYNCGCCVSCKKRLRVPSVVPSHHPVINSHNPATPNVVSLTLALGGAKLLDCKVNQKDLPMSTQWRWTHQYSILRSSMDHPVTRMTGYVNSIFYQKDISVWLATRWSRHPILKFGWRARESWPIQRNCHKMLFIPWKTCKYTMSYMKNLWPLRDLRRQISIGE